MTRHTLSLKLTNKCYRNSKAENGEVFNDTKKAKRSVIRLLYDKRVSIKVKGKFYRTTTSDSITKNRKDNINSEDEPQRRR